MQTSYDEASETFRAWVTELANVSQNMLTKAGSPANAGHALDKIYERIGDVLSAYDVLLVASGRRAEFEKVISEKFRGLK